MISDLKEVVLTPDLSAVVIKADAISGERRTAVELAITTELAAKVAVALLATTAEARAARDALEPALQVLAAAFVPSGRADKVRLHLLFQQGVVLPIEMDLDAAKHLSKGIPKG
ncbi:MAG TPA: hypothetical protein VIW70_06955 [Rubrivivax sp.]